MLAHKSMIIGAIEQRRQTHTQRVGLDHKTLIVAGISIVIVAAALLII